MKILIALLLAFVTPLAHAEDLRPLNTDRPDRSAGPYTVNPGHIQVETDIVSYTKQNIEGGTLKTLLLNNMTPRFGITASVDIEATIATYQNEANSVSGSTARGVGDLTLLMKYNLFGNEGGTTALGLLPFLKLPSASGKLGNGKTEGGLQVPFDLNLPGEFDLDLLAGWQRFANHDSPGYQHEGVFAVALHHPLFAKGLSGYGEYYLKMTSEKHAGPEETADFGVMYLLSPDVQFDIGCNVGISAAAAPINPFLGVTLRR